MEHSKLKRGRTRSISCMRIEKIVGSGTFGVVYKAFDKANDTTVALKKIKMERETQGFPVTAIREIKILNLMKTHRHQNIVYMREIVTYNGDDDNEELSISGKDFSIGDIFMVFEFVDYDLSGLLKSSGLTLTDRHVKSFLKQLLSGVQFLHENHILHRDLKSANLLITKGNVLKIADWGLARSMSIHPDRKLTNPVVTLWYRSPELILGSKLYGPEIDVWSVGCILGEMKTRVAMFRGESEASQLDLIFQATGSPQPAVLAEFRKLPDWEKVGFNKSYLSRMSARFPLVLDKHFFSLLDKLLDINPATRITASAALNEPYLTTGDNLDPSSLPAFTVEPVTEWMEQERQKREYEAQKLAQENKEKMRLERERQVIAQQHAAGRGSSTLMRNRRRQESAQLNKYVTYRAPAASSAIPGVVSGSANPFTGGNVASAAPTSHVARSSSSSTIQPPLELQPGIKRSRMEGNSAYDRL